MGDEVEVTVTKEDILASACYQPIVIEGIS